MVQKQRHVRGAADRSSGGARARAVKAGGTDEAPSAEAPCIRRCLASVQAEIARALEHVGPREADRLAKEILRAGPQSAPRRTPHGAGRRSAPQGTRHSAGRIYVAGSGRSGLVAASFATRLVHLGFTTHVVGESTAPGIERGDLLVMASGSGRTSTALAQAAAAKARGARVAAVTADLTSPLARKADVVLEIPCPPYAKRKARPEGLQSSRQPGGTLFEQSLLIFLDGLILDLAERTGWSPKTLKQRHANLE